MTQPIMVGCDLHDRSMLLKVARGLEEPLTMTVMNTAAGRQKMIEQLVALAAGSEVILAYEASGQGFGLHDQLTAAGIKCFVLAPTKLIRSPRQSRQKTDEKDALDLLELLRGHVLAGNRLPKVWIPDPQTRDDRELVRARLDLSDKQTALKTQIKGLLKRHGVTRPESTGQGWTVKYRAWLREVTAAQQPGVGARVALGSLLRQLETIEKEIAELELRLAGELAWSPRYAAAVRELVKLPGVGVLTALVFLTEIGDLSRFMNRRQISAYLGLAPSSHESGQTSDRKGHITRQGPARVRRVLRQAAWCRAWIGKDRGDQSGHDKDRGDGSDTQRGATTVYQRLVAKNPRRKKIAVVAAMRQLAVLMWHRGRDALQPATSREPARREACCAPAG